MTTSHSRTPAPPEPARNRSGKRTDYSGAVYGSMLAASVIAASNVSEPHARLSLIVLLMITGLVFWAAHVYANVAGSREIGRPITFAKVHRVGVREWSLVEAAVLPAVAVLISPWLGMDETAWLALGVAITQQVGWATLGARRAGATWGQTTAEGAVNLVLGLIIVAAKVAVGH
ncbi:hypothetical protein ACGFX4_24900 [Kitasatospora sp. NPDC048365]|uniref:hypothetical protein n=1 Tax=Kitasatospora sp. NPDC048365 TaxID=3364050 RepID=UPI00371243A2